jgi:acetylglutamate kinase
MSTDSRVRQTIVHLLSNMSESREVRTYLSRFSRVDRSRFAVIKVGGGIIAESLDQTAEALAFLHTVGLTPIVIHGGGPQLDGALEAAAIDTPRRDGLRVTNASAIDVARATFTELNISLVEAIRAKGVDAHGLVTGAFDASIIDADRYGYVGEPTEVHTDLIRSIVESGAIPIITCLGVAEGGQIVNMNADAATRALVHVVQPLKIIFLTPTGALLDENGDPIETISLVSDYDNLMRQEWVHSGMRLKLTEIKRLLDDSAPSASVSITTPDGLARELFTHGGSGTLVKVGERILEMTDKGALDEDRVVSLIGEAFDRPLDPGWWSSIDLVAAYVSESYRAAAILTRHDDFTYLDKFAIQEDARGEGLARAMWNRLTADHKALYWRSRPDNPFNAFYFSEADGSLRERGWYLFWKGETDLTRIGRVVEKVAALPESFQPLG